MLRFARLLSQGRARKAWCSPSVRFNSGHASNELQSSSSSTHGNGGFIVLGQGGEAESSLQAFEKLVNPLPNLPFTCLPSNEAPSRITHVKPIESRVDNPQFAHTDLEQRQIQLEEQMLADAVLGYTAALQNLLKLGKGSGLKFVQRILISW